jgi:hypothetical protein
VDRWSGGLAVVAGNAAVTVASSDPRHNRTSIASPAAVCAASRMTRPPPLMTIA